MQNNFKKLFCAIISVALSVYPSEDLCLKSIHAIMKNHPEIMYTKIHDAESFNYKPFPISKWPQFQPHSGMFAETFTIEIPHGESFSTNGYIKINNDIIAECLFENESNWLKNKIKIDNTLLKEKPLFIPERVVVIGHLSSYGYFAWITYVLDKLRMLTQQNIQYDWLYVSLKKPFMKETLTLLGIDLAKVIDASKHPYIQAKTLIALSSPRRKKLQNNQIFCTNFNLASYISINNINYLRDKLLPITKEAHFNFSPKIFISRNDSIGRRQTTNEEDVFLLFEQYGFKKYCLAEFSVLEQAALFHNAETIVATHGAALTNLIFCKPKTKIIEIFQARSSCTYWYISQQLNLDYYYIKTIDFSEKTIDGNIAASSINQSIIQDFLDQNNNILKD